MTHGRTASSDSANYEDINHHWKEKKKKKKRKGKRKREEGIADMEKH